MSPFSTSRRRRMPPPRPAQPVKTLRIHRPLALLLLSALAASSALEAQSSEPQTEPRPLRIVLSSELEVPDPHEKAWNVVDSLFAGVYDRLLRTEPDGTLAPNLAASWERVDDRTIRFQLRRDVRFHDGSTFDARGVVASYDRAHKLPDGQLKSRLSTIESYRAVDDHVLEIKTRGVDPLLLRFLVMVPILPAEAPIPLKKHIGTGPYRWIGEVAPNRFRLEAVTDSWRPTAREPVVEILMQEDSDASRRLLNNGEADLVRLQPVHAPAVEASETLWIFSRISPGVFFLGLRADRAPLDDVRLRRAVHLALDRAALADTALGGYARPAAQLVGPGSFGYRADAEPPAQDIPAARALVAQTGRETVDLGAIYVDMGRRQVGAAIQAQLAEAGLKVELRAVGFPELIGAMESGKAPLYLIGWSNPTLDLGDVLGHLAHSNEAETKHGLANETGFSDPELDRLIDQAASTLEPEARLAVIRQAESRARDAAFVLPLVWEMTLWAGTEDLDWQPRADYIINPYEMARRGAALHAAPATTAEEPGPDETSDPSSSH